MEAHLFINIGSRSRAQKMAGDLHESSFIRSVNQQRACVCVHVCTEGINMHWLGGVRVRVCVCVRLKSY